MSFFKSKTIWTPGELWIYKGQVLTFCILAGHYLGQYLITYQNWLWFLSWAACIVSAYNLLSKPKNNNPRGIFRG